MELIKTLVFDLDDTLYPNSLGHKEYMYGKIGEFCKRSLNMSVAEYAAKTKEYFNKYGNAYKFYQDNGTSFEEYIKYVCDNEMKVPYNPELEKKLKLLPHQKIIYTDASLKHTIDTLKQLKLEEAFHSIYTIKEANYIWKEHKAAFENFLNTYNLTGKETAIFEDNLKNLENAKTVGMTTIYISESAVNKPSYCDFMFNDILSALEIFS